MVEPLTHEAIKRASERFAPPGEEPKPVASKPFSGRKLDVESYLQKYGHEVMKIKNNGSSVIYGLKRCVFDENHSNNEAAIVQTAEGKLLYQCFHNSCKGKTWHEARQIISGSDPLFKCNSTYKLDVQNKEKDPKTQRFKQQSNSPEISLKKRVDISNVYDSARMIKEYNTYIKTLKNNKFITGINEIDKRIRGVAGGEVLTLIARSGSFKTAMLQNLLKNYIDNSAWAAVFFSIEMPVASLTERYLGIMHGCTGWETERDFSDPEYTNTKTTAENSFIHEFDKLFTVPTRVSLSDVSAYVQLIEREKNIKVGVIGIDYLGLMEGSGISEYEIVSRLSIGLKSTAKFLNIPIIVLAQVSRKGASGNIEISLDMGRGSGAIEEAADFVLGLWQAEDEDGEKELICKILKNRKGPIGSCWKLDLVPHALHIGPNAEKYEPPKKTKGF